MAFSMPMRQGFVTSRQHTISHVHIPPTDALPALLFLHGFPSHIPDWKHQIRHFSSLGYGIVAVDLLGYGDSSKPTDVDSYRIRPMGDEIVELLDHLGLGQVVGVGHDVGSTLLSRLAAYHPERWAALVFLAVGPPKLGTPFDVDAINSMTKQALGFELLGYIPWLGSADNNAQAALEKNPGAAMSLMFAADRASWDEWFHPLHRMEQFVREDRRVPVGEWYAEDLQRLHLAAFGARGRYTGATRWYRMWLENRFAPDEDGYGDAKITQPALFVVPREPEAGADQQTQMLAAWALDLTVVKVDSGHWVQLERAGETNEAIEQFLKKL
ncbi:Microsomal epoxide hydrolase [Purpureocillium takamizusanense]|uniref:Microsomal epoxide hydrolase n=1 Tax=Purpureocillium takamizusanense TaxID=2060973 RepID=A0A9Q8QLI9_9HYPO|nr:Microsomal epoxide hydrolase [Purpureocillium takamizusanense]UNI22228.1 Microsomal epoxide hydrolase [Purpureocillium takamizusanense]